MFSNNLEHLNSFFMPRIIGFYSFNNGGGYVIAMKNLKKYRSEGNPKWHKFETSSPNTDNVSLVAATPDQITDDLFLAIMATEDPKFSTFQANKSQIDSLLGQEYVLNEVGTMLGTLPVITKGTPIVGEETTHAHVFPGEMTDGLDAAPKKDLGRVFPIRIFVLYDWLTGITSIDELKAKFTDAIAILNKPEKFINWY